MPKADLNYRSYADTCYVLVQGERLAPDFCSQFDDILKFSNARHAMVLNCEINPHGGNREDGVDVMRNSYNVRFHDCRVGAGNKYAFTIKGGSDEIYLERVVITRGGGGLELVDIDIGNYSSVVPNAKTGRVYLRDVTRSDGQPVRVRVGWADDVIVEGGNVHVLRCQSIALKAYVQIMRKLN